MLVLKLLKLDHVGGVVSWVMEIIRCELSVEVTEEEQATRLFCRKGGEEELQHTGVGFIEEDSTILVFILQSWAMTGSIITKSQLIYLRPSFHRAMRS